MTVQTSPELTARITAAALKPQVPTMASGPDPVNGSKRQSIVDASLDPKRLTGCCLPFHGSPGSSRDRRPRDLPSFGLRDMGVTEPMSCACDHSGSRIPETIPVQVGRYESGTGRGRIGGMMSHVAAPRDVIGGERHKMKCRAPRSRWYSPVALPESSHLWGASPTATSALLSVHPVVGKPIALRHISERLRADRV